MLDAFGKMIQKNRKGGELFNKKEGLNIMKDEVMRIAGGVGAGKTFAQLKNLEEIKV